MINAILQNTRDLFKVECTQLEHRKSVYENLILLYTKQVF